jgi:hypothetical protein
MGLPRRYAPRNDNLLYWIATSLRSSQRSLQRQFIVLDCHVATLLARTIYYIGLPRRYAPCNDNLLYWIATSLRSSQRQFIVLDCHVATLLAMT